MNLCSFCSVEFFWKYGVLFPITNCFIAILNADFFWTYTRQWIYYTQYYTWLTSSNRILEKPILTPVLKNFPTLHGDQGFITVLKKSPQLAPTLSHINPVHISPFYFSKIHFNIVLNLWLGVLVLYFSTVVPPKPCMYSSYLRCVLHALPISSSFNR
jgi:hypothetical protein